MRRQTTLILLLMVMLFLGSMLVVNHRIKKMTDQFDEGFIATKVRIATLESISSIRGSNILKLEKRVEGVEKHKVLLIMNTGKELMIHTKDGRILGCYFPDQ